MNEQSFERRAQAWLELGPTAAPHGVIDAVFAAIETVPQERPRLRLPGRAAPASWQARFAIAAAVVLAIAILGAIALRNRPTDVATTPVPRDPTSLLKEFSLATVRFEKSGGPTTKSGRLQIGTVKLDRRGLLAYSCTGAPSSDFKVELIETGSSSTWTEINGRCEGTVNRHFLDPSTIKNPTTVWITVPVGVTWQVAIGEFSESFATIPAFAAIPPTDGWKLLYELEPTLVGAEAFGAGINANVPTDATMLAVSVQCEGEASLTILLDKVPQGDARPCRGRDETQRVEFHVEPGSKVPLSVKTDGLAWIRFVVEVNADPVTTWPSAPPMPPAVAATGFAEAQAQFLALGTLGSNRQSLVRIDNSFPGKVGGDYLAVQIPDGTGQRLDLWSISGGSVVRTLARSTYGFSGSWVDATHEQVFYSVATPDGTHELHRVALDGSGDKVVATGIAPGFGPMFADIARDDSAFVFDSCGIDTECRRQIVDTVSGSTHAIPLTGEAPCEIVAVADRFVIGLSWPGCDFVELFMGSVKPRITATPLEGGAPRVLLQDGEAVALVASSTGAQLVYTDPLLEGEESIDLIDIATGERRHLVSLPKQLGPLVPSGIRLPPDWALLASFQLGDFPISGLPRRAPLLINIVTGEQVELVNLPHSEP